MAANLIFLSTLPARGATRPSGSSGCGKHNFYPRSPRGERPVAVAESIEVRAISIHAPREGSDPEDHRSPRH